MPGGIGPVSPKTLAACGVRGRRIGNVANANEIFFNLDGRHVYYDTAGACLYFVDAPGELVSRTIRSALSGMGLIPVIEQLHLDTHACFAAASRVQLQAGAAGTVLMALRLVGVSATCR